jgi:hypothetical protein
VRKITQKTVLWFSAQGKVSLEQPPAGVGAIAFRLEELQEGKEICVITSCRAFEQYEAGVQLFLDGAGRIVVGCFDELHEPLPLRERKFRVVASSPEHLAKQFDGVYDALYYNRRGV